MSWNNENSMVNPWERQVTNWKSLRSNVNRSGTAGAFGITFEISGNPVGCPCEPLKCLSIRWKVSGNILESLWSIFELMDTNEVFWTIKILFKTSMGLQTPSNLRIIRQ